MPLPSGFKVNGTGVKSGKGLPPTPRELQAIAILDKLPLNELLTGMELSHRMGSNIGNISNMPSLEHNRQKVDNKLFWGSRKGIALLRKKLIETEE